MPARLGGFLLVPSCFTTIGRPKKSVGTYSKEVGERQGRSKLRASGERQWAVTDLLFYDDIVPCAFSGPRYGLCGQKLALSRYNRNISAPLNRSPKGNSSVPQVARGGIRCEPLSEESMRLPFRLLHRLSLFGDELRIDLRHLSGKRTHMKVDRTCTHTSEATKCLSAYLDTAMSAARFPSYVTKASIGLQSASQQSRSRTGRNRHPRI